MIKRFFLLCTCFHAVNAWATRAELNRYTLLRDKVLIERSLKNPHHGSYFSFDIHLSSGLKTLISDTENAYESNASIAAQTLAITEVLSRNLNTERYLDLDLELGFPLPFFKMGKSTFLPSFFYQNNIGSSLSISNANNGLISTLQLYFKWDEKIGFHSKFKWREKNYGEISLYRLARKDLSASLSNTQLVADKGKVLETDDLKKPEIHYALDYRYSLRDKKRELSFSLYELKFMRSSSSEKKSIYPSGPLLDLRYKLFQQSLHFHIDPFIGIHYRNLYSLNDGLYLGSSLKSKKIPFELFNLLDSEFITLSPRFHHSAIRVAYTMKLPYQNPRDDIWVSTIHSLSLYLPF